MKNYEICVFLTGNIAPQNVPNLKRNNISQREIDYYSTIKKWMELNIPIIFCENSNYDSKKIDLLFAERYDCEYIKFETKHSFLGKSHGEAEIFAYAFENSKFLKQANWVYKVTGRYYIMNSAKLLSKRYELSINVACNLSRNLTWADSRFFGFTPKFFDLFLKPKLLLVNESIEMHFEKILANAILHSIVEGNNWSLLEEYPIYEGIYGTNNLPYKSNLFHRLKFHIFHRLKKWTYSHSV